MDTVTTIANAILSLAALIASGAFLYRVAKQRHSTISLRTQEGLRSYEVKGLSAKDAVAAISTMKAPRP